ncbi:hypothetical protein AOC28_07025 [Polynucleobacter sp. MWH-Adler-W8]|nr:hypothetical protein AOC28_07025 [Polynucleobacter sp. MWH-Adler-W8]
MVDGFIGGKRFIGFRSAWQSNGSALGCYRWQYSFSLGWGELCNPVFKPFIGPTNGCCTVNNGNVYAALLASTSSGSGFNCGFGGHNALPLCLFPGDGGFSVINTGWGGLQ